jgi:hypothetical protein
VALGFLQLCSERRYHRQTMLAFEQATGLAPDEYWIEARPGGTPSWSDNTKAARLARSEGAEYMGWAAHGDRCGGFPGASNLELARKLDGSARKRAAEFPGVTHLALFAAAGHVEVREVRSGR